MDNQNISSENPEELPVEKDESIRVFYDGKFLDATDSDFIAEEVPTQVVILAGASESGKTTLLASMYEKFSNGKFAGYAFSGSKTLPGFEERCHLARIASMRSKPDTERTKAKNIIEMLHLKVAKQNYFQEKTNILLTDISGETFRTIRDSTEQCRKMKILSRADHFSLLIDGAHLANVRLRQIALSDSRALLRSCFDSGMLGKHTLVEVVFSKWDLIEPRKRKSPHTKFVDFAKGSLNDEFGKAFGKLAFYEIASRPADTTKYAFGYNLDSLFLSWVSETPERQHLGSNSDIDLGSLGEIDKFASG